MQPTDVPLCVDLDGTLILTDLSIESALALLRRNPLYLLPMLWWLLHGRAHFKREVARRVRIDVTHLPCDERVLAWLREIGSSRRRVLCTASDQRIADAVAAEVGCFDEAIGSDGVRNIGGRGKRDELVARYGERGFDYAGNAATDLHVWRAARQAIVVNASPRLLARARRDGDIGIGRVFERERAGWRIWLRALRPHQWLKNLLVFVAVAGAHRLFELDAALAACAAFVAFSLCASSAYVLNDLFDLDADRRHPHKRLRPFAAGRLPLVAGLVASPLLALAAFALAWLALPPAFSVILFAYFATTLAYSLFLKRVVALDVLVLAALYTLRVFAGAAAVPVEVSPWLLALSMCLFLSLAMVKRHAELHRIAAGSGTAAAGRAYRVAHLPAVRRIGEAVGYAGALVLLLYVDSTRSAMLYRQPAWLWLLGPLLAFWIHRVWRLARNGAMHEDPVVFALTDRISLVVLALFALVIALAI